MYQVLFCPGESTLYSSPTTRYTLPVSGHQDTLASSKKNSLPRSCGVTILGRPIRINCLSGTINFTASLDNCPLSENPATPLLVSASQYTWGRESQHAVCFCLFVFLSSEENVDTGDADVYLMIPTKVPTQAFQCPLTRLCIQLFILVRCLLQYLIPLFFGPMTYLRRTTSRLPWSKSFRSTFVIRMDIVAYRLLAKTKEFAQSLDYVLLSRKLNDLQPTIPTFVLSCFQCIAKEFLFF